MRQLWRATWDAAKAGTRSEQVSTALTGYRDVLIVWNDNLNRILALVQTYFGDGIRRRLEEDLYEDYSAIGRALEDFVRPTSVAMLDLLQTGHLGSRCMKTSGHHRCSRSRSLSSARKEAPSDASKNCRIASAQVNYRSTAASGGAKPTQP